MRNHSLCYDEVEKMKVFISWSGNKSHKIGMVFRDWLPSVIQTITPYVSSEDIDKGVRWSTDIAKELSDSTFGILCVTKDNLNSPWLSFEAGALSKTMEKAHVAPFLFDIKRSEVNGPILQFQSTIFEKEDIKKLVSTLNKACGDAGIPSERLNETFEVWYPTLETKLKNIVGESDKDAKGFEEKQEAANQKSEILEEILDLSRENQKLLRNPDSKVEEKLDEIKRYINQSVIERERSYSEKNNKQKQYRRLEFLLDEFTHSELFKRQKSNTFLIVLSFYRDDFPWIYHSGMALVDILNSSRNQKEKQKAIRDFLELVNLTSMHPIMRDLVGQNSKESMLSLRNLNFVFENLLQEMINE